MRKGKRVRLRNRIGCLCKALAIVISLAVARPQGVASPDAVPPRLHDMPPERAVALRIDRYWLPARRAGVLQSEAIAHKVQDGIATFVVGEPHRGACWTMELQEPVDFLRYPIVVVRYRATNTDEQQGRTAVWLDDGTGPNFAGVNVFSSEELLPDGQVHVLRKDLRELSPRGPIRGIALFVWSGRSSPAVIELLAVGFHGLPDAAPEPLRQDDAIAAAVFDPQGKPLEGARVIVDAERKNFARSALTDESGTATVTPLRNEAHTHMLRVEMEGMVPVEYPDIAHAKGAPIRITLMPAARYGGMVQDEAGEPVEGASVGLFVPYGRRDGTRIRRTYHILTDADGRWQSPLLPAGLERLAARLAHADYISEPVFNSLSVQTIRKLAAGTAVMVLRRGPTVTGRVLDREGNPIVGAAVKEGRYRESLDYPVAHTDARGAFRFDNVRTPEIVLTVQKEGYAPELKRIHVGKGMEPVEFVLAPGGTIKGKVADADGNPVRGAVVSADIWRGRRSIEWSAKTDSEGRFKWDSAPEDAVRFDISAPGYMDVHGRLIKPSEGEQLITVQRELKVSGSVVDADSKEPIEKFRVIPGVDLGREVPVSWQRWEAATFEGGHYEVTFDQARQGHLVLIEAKGYLPRFSRTFKDGEGDQTYDFELKKGTGPTGIVRSPDGTPLAGAEVILGTARKTIQIRNGRLSSPGGNVHMKTGPDGRYSFPPQFDRYGIVVVHDEGYAVVAEQELGASWDVTVQPWGRVEGTVRIGARPAAGGLVRLWVERQDEGKVARILWFFDATADERGRFVLERVRPGAAWVGRVVEVGQGRSSFSHAVPVDVGPGQTVHVTIGGTGRPVTGRIAASARNEGGLDWSWSEGVLVLKPPPIPVPEALEGKSPAEKLAWQRAWVASEDGKAYRRALRAYAVKIEPDGAFRVDDVPAGSYGLRVQLYEAPSAGRGRPGEVIGSLIHEFEVAEMPGGRSDEPLELGTLEMELRKRVKVGEPAPPFQVQTLDGKPLRLADFRGKFVLLDFWATWCGPCLAETPHLKALYDTFGHDARFVMISLSLDQDVQAPRRYVRENDLKWVQGFLDMSARASVSEDYQVQGIPSIFLIGPDGKIIAKDLRGEQMKAAVAQALGRK